MHTFILLANLCGGSSALLLLRAAIGWLDPKTEVYSGYPAYCNTWLTIYHHRKTQRWSFEWYERADCRRPLMLEDASACLMREVTDKGASLEECSQARSMLRTMAFFEA